MRSQPARVDPVDRTLRVDDGPRVPRRFRVVLDPLSGSAAEAEDVWGPDAESAAPVYVDVWESYLVAA